jgi:glutathione peroxidase
VSASVYGFATPALGSGRPIRLADYRGKVLLIVNTASECGFTPQYAGLERLWRDYRDRGLVVIGYPCNQFGNQEPGSGEEIAAFCSRNYGVTFPMAEKVEVNGPGAHPLWQYLTREAPGLLGSRSVKWNFTKFLVDREGRVMERYGPATKPEELRKKIEALL